MRTMAATGHSSNLDILRSVAVLTVFLTHFLQITAGCKVGDHFAYGVETYSLGHVGVLIFFVHTSLVLMQSLERTGAGLTDWPLIRYFYIRRAFRIYPLSVCLVVLSITFSIPQNALGTPYTWYGAKWVLRNLLLIQNLADNNVVSGPMWSLPYEVQMYLALPILFLVLRATRGFARLICIYLIGSALSLFHPVLRYLPCFLAGVIAYRLLGRVQPRFRAWLWCPAVIGAVVLYVRLVPYSETSWLADDLSCLIIGGLIPLFRKNAGPITAVAAHVAKYSYGIYLCHMPIIWLLYRKLAIPDWQRPMWLVIATGLVAIACYHAIEQPLIEIGSRLANRVSTKPQLSPAVAIS
jgi:peptidoglycan/LPS O-acetylase OafA/YrhL